MNQAELVVIDRARQWVNNQEENGKEPTKADLIEQLNLQYQTVVGMGEAEASAHAENYVMESFIMANPNLAQQVVVAMYGEEKIYQDLTDQEKGFVDQELDNYYKIYRNGEVR